MSSCGAGLSSTGQATRDTVENQIVYFTEKGNTSFNTALDALTEISQAFSENIGAGWGSPQLSDSTPSELPAYTKPTPEIEEPEWEFIPPSELSDPPEDEYDYSNYFSGIKSPTLTAEVPTLNYPPSPSTPLPTRPEDPEPLVIPPYPNAPVVTEPTLPVATAIVLPTLYVPDISGIQALIADLRSDLPISPEVPPDINFTNLVNELYSQQKNETADVLSELVGRINQMLGGGTGILGEIADLLRNRAFQAEDRQALQAENDVLGDWLARGFTLPGGALEYRVADIRQKNRDKKAELNRDIWIEEAKFEIENMRVAVQQGIAYEGMWKDSLIKLYGICGEVASQQAKVQLDLVTAAVDIYKAQTQLWTAQFAAVEEQVKLELSKVEIYKAELEGQKLIGDLNQQSVDIYRAQLEALSYQVNLYKVQVDAANSLLQAELGKLEYAAKKTQLYVAEISAWEAEWKGYGEAMRGEGAKTELYKSMVQGFSAEVEAYARNIDAAKSQATLQLESLQSRLKNWEAQAEKYKATLQTEVARVGTLAQIYETSMRGYALKHESEKTYVGTELNKLDYLLNVDKLNADVTLKEAELEQQKMLSMVKIAQDALDAVARTSSQLAGSAMSAMNVGASISSGASTSQSTSCSEQYSYTA